MKQTKPTHGRIYVPTHITSDGLRHIIARKDAPPLCNAPADGTQYAPSELLRANLCQRCVQRHLAELLDTRFQMFGL